MKYNVIYEKNALKNLSKIDSKQRIMILSWIEKNLINTENPRQHGKSLKGSLNNYWRYRVGNYRILVDINDREITIIIVNIGHRKDIYE